MACTSRLPGLGPRRSPGAAPCVRPAGLLTGPVLARTLQRVVGRGPLVGLAVAFHDQEPPQRHDRDLSVGHRRPPSPRPESFTSELVPAGSARRRGQRPSPPPVHRSPAVAATWKASRRLKRSAVGRVVVPVHREEVPVALHALERSGSAVVQDDVGVWIPRGRDGPLESRPLNSTSGGTVPEHLVTDPILAQARVPGLRLHRPSDTCEMATLGPTSTPCHRYPACSSASVALAGIVTVQLRSARSARARVSRWTSWPP